MKERTAPLLAVSGTTADVKDRPTCFESEEEKSRETAGHFLFEEVRTIRQEKKNIRSH